MVLATYVLIVIGWMDEERKVLPGCWEGDSGEPQGDLPHQPEGGGRQHPHWRVALTGRLWDAGGYLVSPLLDRGNAHGHHVAAHGGLHGIGGVVLPGADAPGGRVRLHGPERGDRRRVNGDLSLLGPEGKSS